MAHGERAALKSNKRKELWGRRPYSGDTMSPTNRDVKRLCHHAERRVAEREIRVEAEDWIASRPPPGYTEIDDLIAEWEQDPVKREALVDARQRLAERLNDLGLL